MLLKFFSFFRTQKFSVYMLNNNNFITFLDMFCDEVIALKYLYKLHN